MAGMKARYTSQLVLLTTVEDGDLVAALEVLMKERGEAVSRADVLRQALAPGLTKLRKRYEDLGLDEAVRMAKEEREGRTERRERLDRVIAAGTAPQG